MTDPVTRQLWFEAALDATTEKHLSSWERAMVLEGMDVPQRYEKQAVAGWPKRMPPFWIGILQFPDDPQKQLALRSGLVAACVRGTLSGLLHPDAKVIDSKLYRVDPWSKINGLPTAERLDEVNRSKAYKIDAEDAADWFARREMQPSEHIASWFAACGLAVASAPSTITPLNSWGPAHLAQLTVAPSGRVIRTDDRFAGEFAKLDAYEIANMSPERLAALLTPKNLENLSLHQVLSKVVLHIDRVSNGVDTWASNVKATWDQVAEWLEKNCYRLAHSVHKTPDADIDNPQATGWRYHPNGLPAKGPAPLTATKFTKAVSAARKDALTGKTRHQRERSKRASAVP